MNHERRKKTEGKEKKEKKDGGESASSETAQTITHTRLSTVAPERLRYRPEVLFFKTFSRYPLEKLFSE